jgi:heparan-alpha-glucosaminide N-acetyltransferase
MPPPTARVVSLDALRGFTVLVMLFVNDVASVRGVPWWLYHMPPDGNGITPVDVVFPAFLFMVGTAIPLAVERRRREGTSLLALLGHVVRRTLGLVVIGVLVMGGRQLDPAASHVPYGLWNALMLAAVVLAWTAYPQADARRRRFLTTARVAAIVILVVLCVLYRSKSPDVGGGWLDLGIWSILGTIGWAYLIAAVLYLAIGARAGALAAALLALVGWNVATHLGIAPVAWVAEHVVPLGNGGYASIVIAGVLAAAVLRAEVPPARRIGGLLVYAAGMAAAGLALLSFGVSKDHGTPSFCLLTAAITVVLLAAFYYAIDVRGAWTGMPFLSAGRNALVVYLVPDIFYALFSVHWLGRFGSGLTGAEGSALFAVIWVAIGAGLARLRVRMQL